MSVNRLLSGVLLALLLLMGLQLRLSGIASPSLHPDEPTIARWIGVTADHGEIRDRLYPGGFFTLAAPIRKVCQWAAHRVSSASYQAGKTDRIAMEWDDIRFARLLNVGLGLLTCLMVFSLALHITENRAAALAAAAFCLLDPVHIEHCHYAETDVAMLFGLTLTLLLWARARSSGNAYLLLGGALAAGFAAGTKFTLLFLVVPLLALPFLSRQVEQFRRPLGRTLILLALSVLLFAAVFAWTNPLVLHPGQLMDSIASQARGLTDEMRVSLGGAGETAGQLILWRLRLLGVHAMAMGPLFLALAGAGLVAALGWSRFRKAWLILVLVPVLILCVHLVASPFIRKQEFMAYLPVLSILAVLPLALPSADSRITRFLLHGGMTLLVLTALVRTNLDARRVSGLFGWQDPRLAARQWNAIHAPDDKTIAVEKNAAAAVADAYARLIPLRHVADLHEGLNLLDRFPADYLIRDTFAQGRGHIDPVTGQLRPRYQAIWARFASVSRPLMTWAPFGFPRANASHAGHGAALYAMETNMAPPDFNLNLDLLNPVYVSETGRETQFSGDHQPGSRQAILLTEWPREVAAGGPGIGINRLWVTLNTEEREADIRVRSWGRTSHVFLPPWTVRTLVMVKPWWWRVPEPYARVSAWSAPLKSLVSPPCWMRLGRTQAIETGYSLGYAATSLTYFSEKNPMGPLDLFRFAVRAGDWPLAMDVRSEALVAFETLNQALSETGKLISANGLIEKDFNDFARIRDPGLAAQPVTLTSDKIRKRDSEFIRALKESILSRLDRDPENTCVSLSPYRPPFRLAQGTCQLILDVQPESTSSTDEESSGTADTFELIDSHGRVLAQGDWSSLPRHQDTTLTMTLAAAREESPEIHLVTRSPRALSIRRAELRWTLNERLTASRQDLAACFVRLALEEGDGEEAGKWLQKAEQNAWNSREWELLRKRASVPQMEQVESGFMFMPFYRCRDIRLDRDAGRFSLSLTALLDHTPAHEAQVVVRKGRHWKTVTSVPLRRDLMEGETVSVTLPLPGGTPLNAGLRIRTDILTQPGSLSLDGSRETILPLSQALMMGE